MSWTEEIFPSPQEATEIPEIPDRCFGENCDCPPGMTELCLFVNQVNSFIMLEKRDFQFLLAEGWPSKAISGSE